MERQRKLFIAKTAVILGVIPVVIWAHEYGPDAGYCGVPKEQGTCLASGCHTGTLNGSTGSVKINFANGLTYSPGVVQHLSVTISDSATTQKAWGFQLTARNASSSGTQAGTFASDDPLTTVMCASEANLLNEEEVDYTAGKAQTCPASLNVQYMEHSLTGYNTSVGTTGSYTYNFDWTPPATNVGNIIFYVAANAGPGNPPVQTNAHIYTNTFTLTPAAASGPTPTIAQGGVESGASFQPGIVPNSWIAIQGTNLSNTTDTWDKAIVNGQLPTSLDGVTVSIGGKPAYIYYISPTQLNVLAPDVGTGTMNVTVTNSGTTSPAITSTSQTVGPAFFLWVGKYTVATRQDFTWAVANGTFSGVTTVAAKPGDVIILWGTGFGPTSPATPVGVQVPPNAYSTASPVTVTVGGTNATVYGAALAPGFAGLYQVAIQIPASAPDGDLPVVATVNGAQSPTSVFITVKH
jgi:uncharacterized protein (TIGR03437 family)